MKNMDLYEPSVDVDHAIAIILALTGAASVLSSKFRGEAGGVPLHSTVLGGICRWWLQPIGPMKKIAAFRLGCGWN